MAERDMNWTVAGQLRRVLALAKAIMSLLATMLVWLILAQGAWAQSSISITNPVYGATVPDGRPFAIAGTTVNVQAGANVTVVWNGITYMFVLVQPDGTWSLTLPSSALDGARGAVPILATAVDADAATISTSILVSVAPHAPPATPVVTAPGSGQLGPISALTGMADPNHTVILRNGNDVELDRTSSASGGGWNFDFSPALAAGTYNFKIVSQAPTGEFSFPRLVTFEVLDGPTAGNFPMPVPFNSAGTSAYAVVTGVATAATIASSPSHGTATASGLAITYVPNAGYSGPDSFTYTVTGPGGTSGTATVSVTVSASSDALDQTVTIAPGTTPAPIDLTAGTIGDFTAASIGAVSPAEAGTARLEASGGRYLLHFTPSPYFAGTSTVPFTLTGPAGTSSAKITFMHIKDEAFVTERVEQRVGGFVNTRAASLASSINRPSLGNRFGSGPGTINIVPNGNSVALNFASSTAQLAAWTAAGSAAEALAMGTVDTRFNAWIDGSLTLHLRNDGAQKSWGRFAMVSVGADYLVDKGLLLGVALHGDFMVDEDDFSSINGSGFMIGPYVSMEVSDGLFVDAELYYGRSWNDVSAGLFRGTFDTTRLMGKIGIEGEVALGDNLTLRPMASLFYLREEAGSYLIADGLGASLAMTGVVTEQIRLAAGGRLEQSMTLGDGLSFTPFAVAQLGLALGSGDSVFTTLSTGFGLSGMGTITLGSELALTLDTKGLAALTMRARIAAGF